MILGSPPPHVSSLATQSFMGEEDGGNSDGMNIFESQKRASIVSNEYCYVKVEVSLHTTFLR